MQGGFSRQARAVLLGVAILVSAPAFAVAAPQGVVVPVVGSLHQGLGRLRFQWDQPVDFDVATEEGHLVLQFERAVEPNLGAATKTLSSYIGPGSMSADGRSLRFALKRPVTFVIYDADGAGVIDLVDKGSANTESEKAISQMQPAGEITARPVTESGAKAAADHSGPLRRIGVRVGEHSQFSRIVFDWRRNVSYEVTQSGTSVEITFGRSARIDVARLSNPPARYIQRAAVAPIASGSKVALTVPANSKVSDMRVGTKVVLDVYAPGIQPPGSAATSPGKVPSTSQPPEEQKPEAATPGESAEPETPHDVADDDAEEAVAAPQAIDHGGEEAEKQEERKASSPLPISEAPDHEDPTATAHGSDPALDDDTGSHSDETAAVEPSVDPAVAGQTAKLRFDFDKPAAASVFVRAGRLWAVFDHPVEFDLDKILSSGGALVQDVTQVSTSNATAVRMKTANATGVRVRRDGFAWILELGGEAQNSETALEPVVTTDSSGGGRLTIPVAEPSEPIRMIDPEVGDELVIVPVVPLGHGVARVYRYPEFSILASSQGIVVVPRIDDLKVETKSDGIEIGSDHGLEISPVPVDVRNKARLMLDDGLMRVTGIDRWRGLPVQNLSDEKRKLLLAAANASVAERENARMDLAEFFLATGRATESLGVLNAVAEDRPGVDVVPRFRLLKGADQLMMGRLDEAGTDLMHGSLDDSDEGALWRLALHASQGHFADATDDLGRVGPMAQSYPRDVRIPVNFLLAETAIEVGDTDLARRYLDVLAIEDLGSRGEGRLQYLEGKLLQANGDFDLAIDRLTKAEHGADRPSSARAKMERIELSLRQGEMAPDEAIELYEAMRFAWRGDEFELNYLRRLGELYIEQERYAEGLATLRQAISYFQDHAEVQDITERMADVFEHLYLHDGAQDLSPLAAISIFEDFRELTPAGEDGDEMIRRLADRLVAVDLLDQASELLDDQVRHRLTGNDQARIGARLALVRLFDNKPAAALDALTVSTVPGMPAELEQQRRHLKARALTDLARFDEAVALLAEDTGIDADMIRADIYWKNQDWRNAGQVLKRLVQASGAHPGQPLDGVQARHVLNQAVALTLGGDDYGLRRLGDDYGTAMDATPYRDAFRLIAPDRGIAFAGLNDAVADNVENVENFQAFLAAYRDRLQKDGLSAIN